MADLLYDLLASVTAPDSDLGGSSLATDTSPQLPPADKASLEYLATLTSQTVSSLDTSEPEALAHESHSLLLSLQKLSKQSHKQIIESAAHHAELQKTLPVLAESTAELRNAIPKLDTEAVRFSTTYNKSGQNEVLARRKRALLLSRNVERIVDVLELPTLLSSSISTAPVNYSSALDLNGHIRRLQALHPDSPLVSSVSQQADEVMRTMATNLVLSLKAPNLKLAASLRTIGWLRRVLPDIKAADQTGDYSQERVLGSLFLVCRLAMLMTMLDALSPLRDLADQERAKRSSSIQSGSAWSGGQQTEKYLKKYIEIFREQSFAIVSMYRSIFPQAEPTAPPDTPSDPLHPIPSPLATFPLHLVEMLLETLRYYLPTVRDQASRDSLLTQVLYCAGSLGRLGGDFGLFLATLDAGGEAEEEWVQVVKRHRLLAGRLESIVGDQKDSRVR